MAEVRMMAVAGRWRRAVAGSVIAGMVFGLVGVGVAGAAGTVSTAKAQSELLQLKDLPKGWSASGGITSSTGGLPSGATLANCLGLSTAVVNVTPPTVDSPQFGFENGVESVTSAIELYSSATQAKAQFKAFTSSKAPNCLSQLFNGPEKSQLNNSFGQGLSAGTITVKKLASSYTPAGTAGEALNFTVSTSSSASIKGEIILLLGVRKAQGMVLTLTSVVNPFPARLAKHLASLEMSRI